VRRRAYLRAAKGIVMTDETEVLAVVQASAGRRLMGIVSLWLLAGLLLYVAVSQPPEFGWLVMLLLMCAGSVWLAERMRVSTLSRLELTRSELRDSEGNCLCRVDEIRGLDRGMFAFKPSNGFLLTLSDARGRAWRPGLWWRLGRRIGIGGMTPASQTKTMAEFISAMVAERDR
jgi:hypothetical protein